MDTQRFLSAVRKYVRRTFPGAEAETVTIRMRSGDLVRLPVIGAFPATKNSGAAESLLESELHVLDHVPGHDKPPATSAKIQSAAGYANKSHFMKILRRLRVKGQVVLDATGYRRTK